MTRAKQDGQDGRRLSLRAFAARPDVNVSGEAIRKAIKNGRISPACYELNDSGQPSITDPDRAAAEFATMSDPRKRRDGDKLREAARASQEKSRANPDAPKRGRPVGTPRPKPSAEQIQAQRAALFTAHDTTKEEPLAIIIRKQELIKLRRAEIALETEEGRLVNKAEFIAGYSAQLVQVRNKVRGIPSVIKLKLPHLTAAEVLLIGSICNAALSAVADSAPEPIIGRDE